MSVQRKKSACYCINLRRVANAMTAMYDMFLEPIGLSVNQYSLLLNIDQLEMCSVSDLATCVGLERTTLVRTLKPLFDQALIEDISDVTTRNREIQVTSKGKELLAQGKPLWEKAQNEIEQKLGEHHIAKLSEILTKLKE